MPSFPLLMLLVAVTAEPPASLGLDGARHLLTRTAFGATSQECLAYAPLSPLAAVAKLMASTRTHAVTPALPWMDRATARATLTGLEGRQRQQQVREWGEELRQWWYGELLASDSPFTERMVLFWHNHFTSSLQKVKDPLLLHQQNQLFRQHALGNLRTLTRALVSDPAMLLYLDGNASRRERPNENFARELLELFTLGEGHYTEQDIKQAARAFTGWRVARLTGTARFVPRQHDRELKTFLGQQGRHDADSIIDIIFQQPRVAIFITEKLWREFVDEHPDPLEVQRLAAVLRDHDYQLRPLLTALLTSPRFLSASCRGTLIKSPIDLVVGTLRSFEIEVKDPQNLTRLGRGLGQDLFNPPNVKGWPGGRHWIGSSTLLAREQLLTTMIVNGAAQRMAMPDEPERLASWLAALGATDDAERRHRVRQVLLPLSPVVEIDADQDPREHLTTLLLDPTYQLK